MKKLLIVVIVASSIGLVASQEGYGTNNQRWSEGVTIAEPALSASCHPLDICFRDSTRKVIYDHTKVCCIASLKICADCSSECIEEYNNHLFYPYSTFAFAIIMESPLLQASRNNIHY